MISPIRTARVGSLVAGDGKEIRTELDSHADTCVVGNNTALLVHDFDRPVRVHGYDDTVSHSEACRTISAVIAYDHPESGEAFMLIIHQAILIPGMKANLLSPMQLRDNDLRVNDEPKFMVPNPTEDHHAIYIPEVKGESPALRIPLSLHGVTSYFPTRKPTRDEYEKSELDYRLELTSESPEWEPSTTRFQEQEDAMLDPNGNLLDKPVSNWSRKRIVAALNTTSQGEPIDHALGEALESAVSCQGIVVLKTSARGHTIGPETLAKNWSIGLPTAKRTIEATTQSGVRTILHPTLSRRFRTNDRQLRYRRLSHYMFTDTLESRVTSWFCQNKYAQVFATRFGWVRVYPMKKKSDAHEGLSAMAHGDGVPPLIVMDGAKEQTMGEFRRKARQMGIHVKQTEPYSPWQNAAEGAIREVKRGAGRKMARKKSPASLWDHCLELEGFIRSNTALNNHELQGQVPETILSGQTADISPFVEHAWYDWIYWWDTRSKMPEPREVLGRWLGPAIDIGPAMTSKILKENGQVIYSSTYRAITGDEMQDPKEKAQREKFDANIARRLGKPLTPKELKEIDPEAVTPEYELYEDDMEGNHQSIPDVDDVTPEELDNYVGAEVNLPFGGTMRAGRVKSRARNAAGELVGTQNSNPILDTRVYTVEFPEGEHAEVSANVIAEHMFSQCDPDGRQFQLLQSIVDHKSDGHAVKPADRFITVGGRQYPRKTTAGWKLCVEWKNGSTSWERLADLKESYPIEVAEYSEAQGIADEPAFAWWVPFVLKKRERIIAAVKKRYCKRNFKFGFEVPDTVQRAKELDRLNGNTLWMDALAKEMANVRVAFKILDDGADPPPGYQFMKCHIIWDIKLDGLRRKARLVAGGHMTKTPPPVMTYASVVSRETVRIALTIAALNDLQVKASDVQNAYLASPCEEKIWTVLGTEFGQDAGKKAIIVRALYGLKSSGGSFSRHISDCMRNLGYTPCKANPDLWFKPEVRPDDGFRYYAYVLLYVDDCLSIHHDAETSLHQLDKFFQMKPGSIGDPDIYLGAKLRRAQLPNGVHAWSMSASKYVQENVNNAEEYLGKNFGGRKLSKRVRSPWPTDYVSELDTTPELKPELASYYQSQIGILHWIVELGRVDIITEVSLLASQMAQPREGHLEAVFHVFAYLKKKHNARMVFDPTYPDINMSVFKKHDWTSFYGDIKESIPIDRPEPRGKEVDLRMFVDADHAGDKRTRRSRTGFFIFLNSAVITWMSKRQPTVETSVFGAEFVAMKQGVETLRGIRYKLRMMGVPISGPSFVYGDNMSVIHNTQRPESTLRKKSNQICYHAVRESVAMNECLTGHIDTNENPADLGTKVVPGGSKRNHLVGKLLYDICDYE